MTKILIAEDNPVTRLFHYVSTYLKQLAEKFTVNGIVFGN